MHFRKFLKSKTIMFTTVLGLFLFSADAYADAGAILSTGETVYVSIYSNLYAGPKAMSFQLAAMLSIRNTDQKGTITITKADYYDSEGKLIKNYVPEPIQLKPLTSTFLYIHEADSTGGSGANFIVKWESKERVNKPIIEGIMTGFRSGQGVSFRCPAQELADH